MFKRAELSVKRKPSKTIILIIVMFVMANLVLASLATKNAVNESTDFAKKSLGSTVYLAADMDKIREQAQQNATQEGGNGPIRIKIERPSIYLDMVTSIAESEYIKDYTYGINANAKEGNFTALENNMSSGGPTFGNSNGRMSNLYGNMQIIGINSYAFISEVESKIMELVDGTYFDELTDNKVIISNELASENNLKVGDKITLINEEIDIETMTPDTDPEVKSSKSIEVEIIGIYDINTDNFNGNTIYMNVETAANFLKEESYNDGNYGVDNISFFLNSPEDADKFIKEANEKFPNMEDDNLKLDINNDAYDKMAGPIEQVGDFADTILWIVIIASILIIALIINNNVKDRKYEMGVLMSLGATKKNIIGQVLLELLFIGTIGFILSIGTSYFLANSMGKSMLDNQLKLAEEQQENNYGRPGVTMGSGMMISGGSSIGGMRANNVDAIDTIDISVVITDYLVVFLIGYLISGVALIVPSINIVKYEPKTILTGRQ